MPQIKNKLTGFVANASDQDWSGNTYDKNVWSQVGGSTPTATNFPSVVTSGAANQSLSNINTQTNNWTTGIQGQNQLNAAQQQQAALAKQQADQLAMQGQTNAANTGAALTNAADKTKTNALLESLKAQLATGAKDTSTYGTAQSASNPNMTQSQELNAAYQRIEGGTATEADINNVNYAKDKGWLPTTETASLTPMNAEATTPNVAIDKTDRTKFDQYGNPLFDKDGQPTSAKFEQDLDTAHADYVTKMNSITNGTFALSPEDQAQVDAMRKQFDDLIAQQKVANKNYEGATDKLGIVSGRSRYAGEEQVGIAKTAVDQGISKIADLESKALASIASLKQAIKDKNYKVVETMYKETTDYLGSKQKIIADTYKAVAEANKAASDAITTQLNQQKLKADIATETVAPILMNSLTGNATQDQQTINDLAEYYNIDANTLLGAYNTLEAKKTAEDLKTKQSQEKIDAAANKLTSKTYKGVTTWYNNKGQQVNPTTGQPVSSPVKQTGPTPTPKAPVKPSPKTSDNTTGKFNEKAAVGEMVSVLNEVTGSDGYVSPGDYTLARKQWVSAGGSATVFDTKFKGYKNPKNPNYIKK